MLTNSRSLRQSAPEENASSTGNSGEMGAQDCAQRPTVPAVPGDPLTYRLIKRALDIVVSGTLLIALSPLLVLIAVAVKSSSAGPIFYRWRVVGKGGRPLLSYKFRSMYVNADQRKAELLGSNEMVGPVFKIKNDPRVTRVGAFIRKYSLDELPQLWSVFKGDLSLVGPRPPLQSEYALFTEFQKQKLQVQPGLTCLWQVNGRNNIKDFDDWVRLDLEYIRRRSLMMDIKIILRTAPVVLLGRGQ